MLAALSEWLNQSVLADLPSERRSSYFLFALALFLALCSSQFIGPVKTAIFMDEVGAGTEPLARSLIIVVLLPVLMVYNLLAGLLPSGRLLVAAVCGAYVALYVLIAVLLLAAGGGGPAAARAAWLLYYATETKSVIVMPMIWSVVADVSTTEFASKAFPMIICFIQIGGLVGSLVAIRVDSLGGETGLVLLQAGLLAAVVAAVWGAFALVRDDFERQPLAAAADAERGQAHESEEPAGALAPLQRCLWPLREGVQGLWLLLSRPYVLMTFWVSYANLLPRTILDYENQSLVMSAFSERRKAIQFFGRVNLFVNLGACAISLLGTRFIVRFIGLGRSLLILPVTMMACVIMICVHFNMFTTSLAIVVSSSIAYGLNSPCKEMLFVCTSRDIKYKAKSWSEMYGNNVMKLLGAQVNLWLNREHSTCRPHCFQEWGTLGIVAGWVTIWMSISQFLKAEHEKLEQDGKVVY